MTAYEQAKEVLARWDAASAPNDLGLHNAGGFAQSNCVEIREALRALVALSSRLADDVREALTEPSDEQCHYCGQVFPYPVLLHHSEDECNTLVDVREALARTVAHAIEPTGINVVPGDYKMADAILAAFEVRPYGTVTDDKSLRSRIEQMVANQQSWIDAGRSDQVISRDAMRDALQKELDETVRPYGTVTAEVEWEYGAQHSQGVNVARNRAEAERWVEEFKARDHRLQWAARGRAKILRRRKAGEWEPVDAAGEARS